MSWATVIAGVVVGAIKSVYWWLYRSSSATRPTSLRLTGNRFLEPETARKKLFETILDEFARSRSFSFPPDISSNVFVVYAHNNEKEGAAYDDCVRQLITWLERIHAQILSDQSPLPLFTPRVEGTKAIGNILANQMCLLPPDHGETPVRTSVDKIIVCGSEVLEAYCRKPAARAYIEDIVRICTDNIGTPAETNLESRIRDRVDKECERDDFHHVLTELAFIEVRVRGSSETHELVPVVLNQIDPDEPLMQYLPCFRGTDVKLKLKSSEPSSLHTLFFKLLKRLYPEHKDFIRPFENFYTSADKRPDLYGTGSGRVAEGDFTNVVNRGIKQAFEEYRKACGVFAGNSVLQNYTAKLSDKTSRILEHVSAATHSEILDWLSTIPTSEIHGKYQDSGTKRVEGTCDWVIQDAKFRQWHKCEKSALLWLNGKMGTGKSYCTSRVIDWVRSGLETSDNDEGLAFFYCNKQDRDRSQAKGILRNIIRQLASGPFKTRSSNTAVEKTVHDLWKKHRTDGIGSTFAEWEACLVALIETYPRTSIVLDALDECGYDDSSQGQEMIKFLVNLVNRSPGARPVKVFVSGRPQDNLRRHLGGFPTIRMQEKHNANDIASFLRIKISEHHPWSEYSRQFQDEMVQGISALSGNMFLLASLQFQQLRKYTLQSVLKSRVNQLPGSLNDIYQDIYRAATSDPDERKFLDKALRWVLCAPRPLTTEELLFAISQEFESDSIKLLNQDLNEGLIRRWTHNLLSLEDTISDDSSLDNSSDDSSLGTISDDCSSQPGVWRLAHQAVAEFLQQSSDFTLSLAHCEAGKVCLLLLIDTFHSDPAGPRTRSDSRGAFDKEENFKCPCPSAESVSSSHSPLPCALAEYAAYAWPTHIRAQNNREAPGVDSLSFTLQRFLGHPEEGSPTYRRWIDHAFHGKLYRWMVPEWSIFHFRQMHSTDSCERVMTPMLLASHLGIYVCLSDWWGSANINYNEVYHPGAKFRPCDPWYIPGVDTSDSNHSWSLVSLACIHNETAVVRHVLERNAPVNTATPEDVPPIVAAVVGGGVESVSLLIQRGADICSPFTTRHGHILLFAIRSNSIHVLELLMQQPGLSQAQEIESILTSLDFKEFQSAQAIAILIGKGVNVNTPLKVGTLLLAAASRGWKDIVDCLLGKGARFNAPAHLGFYDNTLDALISSHHMASPAMIALFVKDGAQMNCRVLMRACEWAKPVGTWWDESGNHVEERKELLLMLLKYISDINETWTCYYYRPGSLQVRDETSALIEAVTMGEPELVRLLSKHGANVNLRVENQDYGDALGSVFHSILEKPQRRFGIPSLSTARKIMNLLIEEGASLDNLEGHHLQKALAAAAFAGWEEPMQRLLHRGASPYKSFPRKNLRFRTALDAAVWSSHPEAPLMIVHALLNNDTSVMDKYEYYETALSVFDTIFAELLPGDERLLYNMGPLRRDPGDWLEIAYVLARNYAVWDKDTTQWIKLLKSKRPDVWEANARGLSNLKEKLAQNRARFFEKFPYAKSLNQWRLKNAQWFIQRQMMLRRPLRLRG